MKDKIIEILKQEIKLEPFGKMWNIHLIEDHQISQQSLSDAADKIVNFISVNNSVSGNEGLPKSIKESPEVAVCWNCGKRLNYTIHGKTYSHCECGAAQ